MRRKDHNLFLGSGEEMEKDEVVAVVLLRLERYYMEKRPYQSKTCSCQLSALISFHSLEVRLRGSYFIMIHLIWNSMSNVLYPLTVMLSE